MGETSWAFLFVGSFTAVGAALAIGTVAAIVRYHRTGVFPGADASSEGRQDMSRSQYAALWVRVAIGAALAVAGVIAMERTGLI